MAAPELGIVHPSLIGTNHNQFLGLSASSEAPDNYTALDVSICQT